MNHSLEVLSAILPLLCVLTGPSHAGVRNGIKSVVASRAEAPIVIDGVLDEPCWAAAQVATDFVNYRAERPALEPTLVRIPYDDETEEEVGSAFFKAVYRF